MKYLKIILKILSGVTIIVMLFLIGFSYYLKSHKAEIFKDFENWYSENYNGKLTVEDVSVSTFKNFPSIALVVKNVKLSDTIYQLGKTEAFAIDEIHLLLSFEKMMQKKIEFKSLKIKTGSLSMLTDEYGNNNHQVFKSKKNDSTKKASATHLFSENGINLEIEDVDISIINHQKNKRITGKVNKLKSVLFIEKNQIKADVEIDVFMNEMGLNIVNGAFFNGANLEGELKPTFNSETKQIEVPFFDLKIDEQTFKVKASINTEGEGTFKFDLENEETVIKSTKALLTSKLQKKLGKYNMSHPIYTYTTLEGSFTYGSNPLVKIQAHTNKNSVSVNELHFKDVGFNGEFFNRIYQDKRAETESKKDFTLRFKKLNATYKNIPFKFTNSSLISTPQVLNYVDLNVEAKAKTTTLNDLFNSKDFLFTKGEFNLKTAFKGDALNIESIFVSTKTSLMLGDSELLYKPLSLTFELDTLSVEINEKDAFLKTLSMPIGGEGNSLEFSGDIINATSLVFDNNDIVKSNVNLTSDNVRWEDFMTLFKNKKREEADVEKNKPLLSQALKGVYEKFNPSLNVLIGACHYNSFEAQNLTTHIYFKGKNNLYLEKTGFNYGGGDISMKVFLNIEDAESTVFDLGFDTDKLDFGKFLKEFNFFELKSLQEIEKLAGDISMKVSLAGELDNEEGLDTKSLKGTAYFELDDVEVKGFKPLEEVANKIFRKERFEYIKFAPISNTVSIANKTIEIPQMQIQSTAFDFFVEGQLNYDHKTNIWVSVPLSNLKHRDVNEIPELEEFENTGKKIYVQVKEDENGKLEYKLHLNNKKLYEEKGILDEYQEDRKKDNKSRKEYKKKKRVEKREQRKN